MKIKAFILGAFAFFAFNNMTQAQTHTPNVKDRQINQQKRIHQGVRSGELTRGEAVRLQKQQANIQQTKRAAKADGVVTKRERAQIHGMQTRSSAAIHRQKND